jgi:predicted PurR-regulated permease PerM
VVAIGLPQGLHVAALALIVVVAVREFQSYVINPHLMGHSVGLSPLVTLVSVAVVSVLFGSFAVILAVPFTSAVATLIDVFVFQHEPPQKQPRRASPFPQRLSARADASPPAAPDDRRESNGKERT